MKITRYLAKQIMDELTMLNDVMDEEFALHFARFGLSAPKFNVLVHLYMAGDYGLIQTELSKKLMVSRANISGLLERLEKEGLVVRRSDPQDKRVFRVYPTERAVSLIHAILPGHNDFLQKIFSPLGDGEKEELLSFLVKLRQGLETGRLI